jgi:hypothetical protein
MRLEVEKYGYLLIQTGDGVNGPHFEYENQDFWFFPDNEYTGVLLEEGKTAVVAVEQLPDGSTEWSVQNADTGEQFSDTDSRSFTAIQLSTPQKDVNGNSYTQPKVKIENMVLDEWE